MDSKTKQYVETALADTQERVRDFMKYSQHIEDKELSRFFKAYAETEGKHASELLDFLDKMN